MSASPTDGTYSQHHTARKNHKLQPIRFVLEPFCATGQQLSSLNRFFATTEDDVKALDTYGHCRHGKCSRC